MSKRIVGKCNRFFIARRNVYGQITRRGFAWREVPSQSVQLANPADSRQRMDDYLEGDGRCENVWLSSEVGGLMLSHNAPYHARDMELSSLTISPAGELELCKPPDRNQKHALAYNALGNHAVTITSSKWLPAGCSFTLQFQRTHIPPDGMCVEVTPYTTPPSFYPDQVWRFSFGGGYMLEWSRRRAARFGTNLGEPGEVVIAKRPIMEPRNAQYSAANVIDFTFYNMLNKLYILSTAWSGAWVIHRRADGKPFGTLPSAPWSITGTGGRFSVLVDEFRFATSGYVETDWIPMPFGQEFTTYQQDGSHPDGFIPTIWPTTPASAGTTGISIVGSRAATSPGLDSKYEKRLRMGLTGTGISSPIIQAGEAHWQTMISDPLPYNLPSDLGGVWMEATPWVAPGAREEKPGEMNSPHGIDVPLLVKKRVNGQTFAEAVTAFTGGAFKGEFAFAYGVGVIYDDGTRDFEMRMEGFITVDKAREAAADTTQVTLTAKDKGVLLTRGSLLFAPCPAGKPVGEGMAMTARHVGIHPSKIDYTSLPIAFRLDTIDPTGDYPGGNLPWMAANGTHPGEHMRSMADAYGGYFYFDKAGVLRIMPHGFIVYVGGVMKIVYALSSGNVVASYDTQPGADIAQSLASWDRTGDRSAMTNVTITEGIGLRGKPQFAVELDSESMTVEFTDRFVREPFVDYQRNPDIITPGIIKAVNAIRHRWRRGGFPTRLLVSTEADLWKRWPMEGIALVRPDGEVEYHLISSVSNTLGVDDLNQPQCAVEERVL